REDIRPLPSEAIHSSGCAANSHVPNRASPRPGTMSGNGAPTQSAGWSSTAATPNVTLGSDRYRGETPMEATRWATASSRGMGLITVGALVVAAIGTAPARAIVRAWFDGKLVVDQTNAVLRSTDFPNMKFDQV